MTVSVSPRQEGKVTLASAVQGNKTTNMTNGAPPPRQPDTTETPPVANEATPAQEKKDDFLSPKFAALARQEKQIRAERQRLKSEREAFESEKQARLNGYIPKDKFKADPFAALEDAGTSYDELTQAFLSSSQGQVDPTVRALQSQVQELTAKLGQFTKSHEESQTTAYKQAVDTIRHNVKGVTAANPDFEMINALDQHDAVVALIEETFKAEGYVMKEEEAAREVEEHLIEEAIRMASLEKVKKKLAPAPAPEAPTSQASELALEKQAPIQQQQIKTLSNAVNSTAPRGLTERERRQRAILAAQGKLNN